MDFFKRLSGKRVFTELRLILEEENPTPAMIRLHEYDLLKVIHPSFELNKELISLFNSVKKVLSWYDLLFLEESYMKWTVYFLALIRHCNRGITNRVCLRFELTPRYQKIICSERFAADKCLAWLERNQTAKASKLYHKLAGFKTELILYMMSATENETVKRSISQYITGLRYVKIHLQGRDLKKMGLAPGPIYRKILQAVLDARLNGRVNTKDDEMQFARRHLKKLSFGGSLLKSDSNPAGEKA
jgi:tRNA nucleotidyltransferase (CCA-adding enzyme)